MDPSAHNTPITNSNVPVRDAGASSPDLDDAQIEKLLNRYEHEIISVERDGYLIRQGDSGSDLYLILEGEFEVIQNTESGVIGRGKRRRGDIVGERAFLRGVPRTADLIARKDGKAARLKVGSLVELTSQHSDLRLFFDVALQRWEEAARQDERERVETKRRQALAREFQRQFLPRDLPKFDGWEINAYWQPALEVGGDFYDVFALSERHIVLVIADVCDKGVSAALYMTVFRTLLRALAQQSAEAQLLARPKQSPLPTPEAANRATLWADFIAVSTVESTNNYMANLHGQDVMFVTLFFALLDTASGILTYINAGHVYPLHLDKAGQRKGRLTRTGPALGLYRNVAYDIAHVHLEPGDLLFAYTDGVTDARNSAGEFFTELRLLQLLQEPSGAAALIGKVTEHLHHHVAGEPFFDDVSMLAVRHRPTDS